MNKTQIIGNVCHSPRTNTTQNGKTVCNFDVATNEKRNGEDYPTYFRVAAWGRLGEICSQYIEKGKKVYVEGKISARAYTGNDGETRASLELMATDIEFLSPRTQTAAAPAQQTDALPNGFEEINDSDLPF